MNNNSIISAPSIKVVFRRLLSSPRILLAVLVLSPLHTLAPHVYNWYLSEFVSCVSKEGCLIDIQAFGLHFNLAAGLKSLLLISLFCLLSRGFFWACFEIKASEMMQEYFDQAIDRLKKVRATWFDEHPSGKLINQLFGDFSSLQRRFIFSLSDGQVCYYEILAGIFMVAWINPLAAIPVIFFWWTIFRAQIKLNPAFEHVSAISSKRKGRVIEVLSDVIDGAAVYRSYQAESHVLMRLQRRISDWIGTEIFQWRLTTWAWTWMWLLAEAGIALVVISAAWAFQSGHIAASIAGMILVAAGQQQGIISWTLDNVAGFLTSRAKALRLLRLSHLPLETQEERAQLKVLAPQLQDRCPREGTLEFRNLTCSYREDSPITLDGLNLSIPQGSKLALIGRTGSGKSTIIQALFRMLYVHQGDISIDGHSLYDFSPEESREIFGIVPQNPWLFEGTLRENLDLKHEFQDEVMRQILDELELFHFSLDSRIEEGGRNLSLGEKQIICLARCLICDKRIIVMDEPTSNIDLETDAKIQKLIRTKLSGRTLIVIAHRKETIVDFEMVFSLEEKILLKKWL